MRRVTYGGASFLTTQAVADALLSVVAAFARGQRTETLEVPAVGIDGVSIVVKLVLGPMSGLISVPEQSLWPEPDDSDAIAFLHSLVHDSLSTGTVGYSETIAMTDYEWNDTNDSG